MAVVLDYRHYQQEISAAQYSELASLAQGNCRAQATLKARVAAGPVTLFDYGDLTESLRQMKDRSDAAHMRAGILQTSSPPCTS